MRVLHAAVLLLAFGAGPAFAQRIPSVVIPGRPDVPVIINGMDASWSVVEGDYGLDRPIGMVPTVIYRPFAVVVPEPDGGPRSAGVLTGRPTFPAPVSGRAMGASKWFRRQTGRCRPRPRAFSRAGRANRRPARSPLTRRSPRRPSSGTGAADIEGRFHADQDPTLSDGPRQSSSASSTSNAK